MAGRPSKLTDELMEKAEGYLDTCHDNIELTDRGALAFVEVNLPSKVGLAQYLDLDKDTIEDWTNPESERFSDKFSVIVKRIQREQEIRLINKGLGGIYTSKALGAMLSKHGYHEKTETDVTTKGESVNAPVISELTKQLNDLHRGSNSGGDGGTTSPLGTQAQD